MWPVIQRKNAGVKYGLVEMRLTFPRGGLIELPLRVRAKARTTPAIILTNSGENAIPIREKYDRF